jgi:uncharacterized protein DUF6159
MFRRGWTLTKKSWQLVARDRRLLVFPCTGAALGLGLGAVIVWLGTGHGRWGYLVVGAIAYYPATLLGSYLGLAFIAVARRELEGEPFTLADGFRCANSRLPKLLAWSLLATAVLLGLQAIRSIRGGWVAGKLAGWVLGLAWAAAAFFVLPVIALEDVGPLAALRRSARLVRSRWGETVTGVVSLTGFLALASIPSGALIGAGVALWPRPIGVALAAAGVAIIAVVVGFSTTVGQMFQLVLYRYATAGEVTGRFTESELEYAFKQKRSRHWFRRRRKR